MTLYLRIIVATVCLICAPLASKAAQDVRPEPECDILKASDEEALRTASLQMTEQIVGSGTRPYFMHREFVFAPGIRYERRQPYARWVSRPHHSADVDDLDTTQKKSDCHRLREEKLDGVDAVVVSYKKMLLKPRLQSYRCTIWVESQKYQPLKMVCEGTDRYGPFEWTKRWFYRTDVKAPVVAPN
jgi:hypothetical protein